MRDVHNWRAFRSSNSLSGYSISSSLRSTGSKLYSFITGLSSEDSESEPEQPPPAQVDSWKTRYSMPANKLQY